MKSVGIMEEFMNEGKVDGEKVITHRTEWRFARKSLVLIQMTDLTSEPLVCSRQMIKDQGNMS